MRGLSIERLRELKQERKFEEGYALYRQMITLDDTDAETHLVGGQCAKALGNLYAAQEALERSLEEGATGRILGLTRFVLGEVHRQIGEIQEAIEQMNLWFEERHQYPEVVPLLLGSAHFNLGLALRQAKRYGEALKQYHLSCEAHREAGMNRSLCEALHNLAWVACLFGDEVGAEKALIEARPLCTTDVLKWHQRIGEAFLEAVRYDPQHPENRQGNLQKALELAQVIISHEGNDVPVDVRSHACWLAGKVGLELGQIDAAEQLAYEAIRLATAGMNENRCLYDAADLLREVRIAKLKDKPGA